MQNENIKPEWFDDWFERLFSRETTTPLYIAKSLGMKKDVVYRALNAGELEGFRFRTHWRIPRPALRIWLIEHHNLNF